MGKLISLFTNREKRMPSVLIISLLITITAVIFMGFDLAKNRAACIGAYEESQREETEILKLSIEGKSPVEMADFVKRAFPASGARWAFLYNEEEVFFVQNDTTTKNLGALKDTKAFLAYLNKQEGVLTISDAFLSDEGESFYVGMIADRDHVLSMARVTRHETYLALAVLCLVLVFAGGLILVTGLLNVKDKNLAEVHGELVERNEKFAEYEEEFRRGEPDAKDTALYGENRYNGRDYYDKDVFRMLLQKSSDPALFPVTFLLVRVIMGERYYGRDEIFGAMDFIKKRLKSTQILAETGKGKFVAILYKTGLAEAEEQLREILSAWEGSDKSGDLKLDLKLYPVLEDETAEEAFQKSGFEENREG